MDVAPRLLDILVAEDVAPSRALLTAMLEKMGHRVIAVENGHLAVDQVRERSFDLILMDLQMPVLDGVGATRLIRGMDNDRRREHIIAVSANVDLDTVGELVRAGFDDTMLKPVTPARLDFMMAQLLSS
jgi:CheY-like chemotaxis protein